MKEITKIALKVKSKDDFIEFIRALAKDLKNNPKDWENVNLISFLNAIEYSTQDIEAYYSNTKQLLPNNINWKVFADILMIAKMHE